MARKTTLIRVRWDDIWTVELKEEYHQGGYPGIIEEENPPLTLEFLADLCDINASGRGNHELYQVHRILAALLYSRLGREQATALLRDIACYSGLDGMVGLYGEGDAFPDLGLDPEANEGQWVLPP